MAGSSNAPRGSSLGCLVVIGSGEILESGFFDSCNCTTGYYYNHNNKRGSQHKRR